MAVHQGAMHYFGGAGNGQRSVSPLTSHLQRLHLLPHTCCRTFAEFDGRRRRAGAIDRIDTLSLLPTFTDGGGKCIAQVPSPPPLPPVRSPCTLSFDELIDQQQQPTDLWLQFIPSLSLFLSPHFIGFIAQHRSRSHNADTAAAAAAAVSKELLMSG